MVSSWVAGVRWWSRDDWWSRDRAATPTGGGWPRRCAGGTSTRPGARWTSPTRPRPDRSGSSVPSRLAAMDQVPDRAAPTAGEQVDEQAHEPVATSLSAPEIESTGDDAVDRVLADV